MSQNALYFPYIDVPSTAWTTQAILYWDKLASIVPMDHLHHPEQMDALSRTLLSEGLVEPIVPGMFIYQVERFDDCFIEYLESCVLPKRSYARQNEARSNTTRIHAEKMGRIPDFLVESGLATRVDWAWYDVDTFVANQFMAYLATVLSAVPSVNATPITDKASFASALGARRPAQRRDNSLHAFKTKQVILKSLLPVPVGPMDVDGLIRFKQRHGALLPPLRTKIETHCAVIACLADPEARIAATAAFVNECEDHVAEIEAAMRPAFGRIAFASLVPLFGSGLALQSTDQGNVVAYAGAALSLVGTAYQAIASIRGPRLAHEAKPLAYIAHARRELAPKRAGTGA